MQTKKEADQAANQSVVTDMQSASVSALRQAAYRLSDAKRKPKLKTRDLVGLLLCHSARAWRCSLPKANLRLSVFSLDGKSAVRLKNTTA
jgi:hypothetical protein